MKFSHLSLILVTVLGLQASPVTGQVFPAGFDELGRYLSAVTVSHTYAYRMLDYCAREVSEKKDVFENAKAQWDTRNLPMVNSMKAVVSNWFRTTDLPQESISEIMSVIDPSLTATTSAVQPEAAFAALEPEERRKRCGFYAGFVIGGGQDVKVLFPKAQEFYGKYASSKP